MATINPNRGQGRLMPLESSRQDRQQMRQRGAANRRVDNVDFGLAFPTAFRSSRSRSNTPASRASNIARRSREPSLPRHRTSVSATVEADTLNPNPAKRQKLINQQEAQRQTSVFPIIEDFEDDDTIPTQLNDHGRASIQPATVAHFVSRGEFEKENAHPTTETGMPPKKRKKRKSVIPPTLRKKKRTSGSLTTSDLRTSINIPFSVPTEPTQSHHDQAVDNLYNIGPRRMSISPELYGGSENISGESPETLLEDEIPSIEDTQTTKGQDTKPSDKKIRKKRRKRSVNLAKKRRSLEKTTKGAANSRGKARSSSLVPIAEQTSTEYLPDEDIDEAPRRPSRPRPENETALTIVTSPAMRPEAEEGSEEEYNPNDYSPEPETPAPLKKGSWGKRPRQPRPRTESSSEAAKRNRQKEAFPVTTHRMTNLQNLPTVQEDDELDYDSIDDHIQPRHPSFTNRPTPNTIDILAQICREVVNTAITRLPQSQPQDTTADRKRKRSALDAFGNDLDTRLFDMSNAVENRISLEAQVRMTKRKKSDLQAQWVEVRKQRETIALKCDRVRRYHWENDKDKEEKWVISEAASRVELEMGRGEIGEEEGLEFLLRSVAKNVSSTDAGEEGLLEKMKSFNKRLETMAAVLEGRTI